MSPELRNEPYGAMIAPYCGIAALIFLLVAKNCKRKAEYLESVTPFQRLGDLAHRMNGANNWVPLVVSVSGWVGSDTPIKCKYSDVYGVFVEKRKQQRYMKRNDRGVWENNWENDQTEFKAVPWYLDDGANRVYVIGARDLPLTFGSRVFKKPKQSLALTYVMEERGLKVLGVEKTEYVLPLNSHVMVVGEAIKGQNGTIVIRQPSKGQLLVTKSTLRDLIESKRSWSRFCESASKGFGLAGLVLLAISVCTSTMTEDKTL